MTRHPGLLLFFNRHTTYININHASWITKFNWFQIKLQLKNMRSTEFQRSSLGYNFLFIGLCEVFWCIIINLCVHLIVLTSEQTPQSTNLWSTVVGIKEGKSRWNPSAQVSLWKNADPAMVLVGRANTASVAQSPPLGSRPGSG